VALHDDEFATRIAAATELYLALEVARVPHRTVLGQNRLVLEVTRIPMDMIVEKVAFAFGDTGVERVLGPRDSTDPTQETEAQSRLRIDDTQAQADKLQGLTREVAVEDVRSDRKPMCHRIVRHADKFRRVVPPVVMALGLPAGQCPSVLDECRGVEIANAANVGIESEVAAYLLAVPRSGFLPTVGSEPDGRPTVTWSRAQASPIQTHAPNSALSVNCPSQDVAAVHLMQTELRRRPELPACPRSGQRGASCMKNGRGQEGVSDGTRWLRIRLPSKTEAPN
jgi:hypothetical protein